MSAPTKNAANPLQSKPSVPPPSSCVLTRRKDGSTNYATWQIATAERLKVFFPEIHEEFMADPAEETAEECADRLVRLYPLAALQDDRSVVLRPDAAYATVMGLATAERPRALAIALEEMNNERRSENRLISARNEIQSARLKDASTRELAKPKLRIAMSALLLTADFISPACAITIQGDGAFRSDPGAYNSAFSVHSIIRRVLQDAGSNASHLRMLNQNALRALKQGNCRLDVYNAAFKARVARCKELKCGLSEEELIQLYVHSLNVQVFERYKLLYLEAPASYPDTLPLLLVHAQAFYDNLCNVVPSTVRYLDGTGQNFAVYAVDDLDPQEWEAMPTSVDKSPNPGPSICQICEKKGHTALLCFKLLDAAFLTALQGKIREAPVSPLYKGKRGKPSGSGASSVSGGGGGATVSAVSLLLEDSAIVVAAVDSLPSFSSDQVFEAEHDDHADVWVVDEKSTAMFKSLHQCNDLVRGVVPGSTATILMRGELHHDMGCGVVIAGARSNLASGPQLRKHYDVVWRSTHEIRYVHRISKHELVFRLDVHRFKDLYYHIVLDPPGSLQVSQVDFYNPPRLIPVPPERAASTWSAIYEVEALHWALGHMSPKSMKDYVRALAPDGTPAYRGSVTTETIDLFIRHRSCSACLIGSMPSHDQLPSERGLCKIVGHTVQGDFFNVEYGPRAKIPVLLLVDEACLFCFMYAVLSARDRTTEGVAAVTGLEFKQAMTAALSAWKVAGRSMRELKFDRATVACSPLMEAWLLSEGVSLLPKASGQHLGLVEVCGGIAKRRCRSTIAGIRERHGYEFPRLYYPKAFGDVCSILNASLRGGRVLTANQMFFDTQRVLDDRRDLRAAFGEVLLVQKPKGGIGSSISQGKAEWGIVIGRKFDGQGVLEVHLLESKARAFRFKFSRAVTIPEYVMTMLKELGGASDQFPVESADGTVLPLTRTISLPPRVSRRRPAKTPKPLFERSHSPTQALYAPSRLDDVPASGDPDGTEEADSGDEGFFDAASPAAPLEEGPDHFEGGANFHDEEFVGSAQISYREAMKISPIEAAGAMKAEIQGHLDKGLFEPIHLAEVPGDERSLILNSLDGYKETLGLNGVVEKAKARVFVNGSVQKPELLGNTYSPVARIESLMWIAGAAAFLGWIVFKVDVRMAYTTVKRPSTCKYKYLRLSKPLVAIIVVLAPHFADFICPDGTLIVRLTRMLYGEGEAGALFYDHLFGMYVDEQFIINPMDVCVVRREDSQGICIGAANVDDTFFIASSEAAVLHVQAMYDRKFGATGYVMSRGDLISHLGMQFSFDRTRRRVLVSQKVAALALAQRACVTKPSHSTPADEDLFDPVEGSPLLGAKLREEFRSLNMGLMFLATRTYPEALPVSTVLAGRFLHATEDDWSRLLRAISYLLLDPEHSLVIHPGSLASVGSGDCAYGVHTRGESHTGHCEGFKGAGDTPDSFCMFNSGKQSTIAQSSSEGELISGTRCGQALVWLEQLKMHLGFGSSCSTMYRCEERTDYAHEEIPVPVSLLKNVPVLYQDNKSAIHLAVMGRGNFRNTKHIRVRYYYLRDLVLQGELVIQWLPSGLMASDMLTKGTSVKTFKSLLPVLIGRR